MQNWKVFSIQILYFFNKFKNHKNKEEYPSENNFVQVWKIFRKHILLDFIFSSFSVVF